MKQNRASPQQLLPRDGGDRPGRGARAGPPAPLRGRRDSAGGAFPASASGSAAKSSCVDQTRGAAPRTVFRARFWSGRLQRAVEPSTELPGGGPRAPRVPRPHGQAGPGWCQALRSPRDTGSLRLHQHLSAGRKNPSGPAPVVHVLSPLPGPLCPARPSSRCCPLRTPSCVPHPRPSGGSSGSLSYRGSAAALGGGQNLLSPAEPPAVPAAPSPAERTPMEAQLGAARRGARPVHSEPPQTPPPRPPHHC